MTDNFFDRVKPTDSTGGVQLHALDDVYGPGKMSNGHTNEGGMYPLELVGAASASHTHAPSPTTSTPLRLVSSELKAISSMIEKLDTIKPFVGSTVLGLEGVELPYEAEGENVGSFKFDYEFDCWVFVPSTFEETH